MIDRRSFIRNLTLITANLYTRFKVVNNINSNLQLMAAKAGLQYGSASDVAFSNAPPEYSRIFLNECGLYAPIWSWKNSFPSPDSTTSAWEDLNIQFAKKDNLKLTGGHLLWHSFLPDWMNDDNDITIAISEHIKIMGSLYGLNCFSWNVVNEAIEPNDKNIMGLRNSVFLKKLGSSFFDLAFMQAKTVMPNVVRVYNDYGMEADDTYSESRRTSLLKLLDYFKKNEIPVDAIGLQSHLKINHTTFNENLYRNFLKEISDRGYKIMITELDVFDFDTTPADISGRDNEVAALYKQFLSAALDERAVISVVTWGLSDKYSWYNLRKILRADKASCRPLPFDENLMRKPAYYSILKAFEQAPKRKFIH